MTFNFTNEQIEKLVQLLRTDVEKLASGVSEGLDVRSLSALHSSTLDDYTEVYNTIAVESRMCAELLDSWNRCDCPVADDNDTDYDEQKEQTK